jgi:hypothetical protein
MTGASFAWAQHARVSFTHDVHEMKAQRWSGGVCECDAGDHITIDAHRVRIARSEKGPIYAACLSPRSLASRSAEHQPTASSVFSTRKIRTDAAARLPRGLSPGRKSCKVAAQFLHHASLPMNLI